MFFIFKYGLLKFAPPLIWCFLVGCDVCRSFFPESGEFHPFRTPPALRRHDAKHEILIGGWLEDHES